MINSIELAKKSLYGDDGLKVIDFKMFHGTKRDVTPEQICDSINNVITQLEDGDYEVVREDEEY